MKNFNFSAYMGAKNKLLAENNKSFVYIDGRGACIISAPHGVEQVRLGRRKFAEPGSLAFALELQKRTGAPCIVKTKNCFDDANFDKNSAYKQRLKQKIKSENIKYLLDFHGLSNKRGIDVNFGTHMGQSIQGNEKIFDELVLAVKNAGFIVGIDNPFWAGVNTVSYDMSHQTGIWALQVEINFDITNGYAPKQKLAVLLKIFEDFLNKLNKN